MRQENKIMKTKIQDKDFLTIKEAKKIVFKIDNEGKIFWRQKEKLVQAKTDKELGLSYRLTLI